MLRVTAQVRRLGELTAEGKPEIEALARVVLNDVSATSVGMYSTQPFEAGQEIAIVITAPTQIYLRGKVVFCQEREVLTPIISNQSFNYRVGMQFVFESEKEKATVSKYCEDIQRTLNLDENAESESEPAAA